MNTGGWLMLILGVGGMTTLLGWCIHTVVTRPQSQEHLHSLRDIDPGDADP
jgi:hypothetical protein